MTKIAKVVSTTILVVALAIGLATGWSFTVLQQDESLVTAVVLYGMGSIFTVLMSGYVIYSIAYIWRMEEK